MKNVIYQNEYITNKKKVYNILKTKDFKLEYKGLDKMNPQDKQEMYHYILYINGVGFDYYEGLGHNPLDQENIWYKIINAFDCLLKDSDTINFFKSITDFMEEFGYCDYKQALNVFEGCKSINEKLTKLFTRQELNVLRENITL